MKPNPPADDPTEPEADATKRTRTTKEDIAQLQGVIETLRETLSAERIALRKCREQLQLAIGDKYSIEDIAEKMLG